MKKRIFKLLILFGSLMITAAGCSLAVDTQQDITIPLREGGFQLNTNVSFEQARELMGEDNN